MPALDGLRAIAVCLVITCHLHKDIWGPLSGFVGVTIFFVLSGYLITRLALREESVTGRLHLRAFYIRRSFRIFPLYYFVLAIYVLLILQLRLWPEKIPAFRHALVYYLSYLQEIPFWIRGRTLYEMPAFFQTWSLGVEEKFYLVWPLLLVLTTRARTGLRIPLAAAGIIVCVFQGIVTERSASYHLESYGFILMGVLLALLFQRPETYAAFRRCRAWVFPIALAAALTTQFYLIPHVFMRGLSSLYAVSVTLLLAVLVATRRGVNRPLSWPALVLTGRLSYGIYLTHILCLGVVERVAKPEYGIWVGISAYIGTLALSAGVAYVLHRCLELPMIRVGRNLSAGLLTGGGLRPHQQ